MTTRNRDQNPPATSSPSLDEDVQGALGRKLRETYDEVVKEEIPPKFLRLLEELKQKEQTPKKDDT